MKVSANFTYSKVLYSQENEDHLVVSLEAPALAKTEKRLPVCVVAVIDISTSMSGDKLDFAKKSALKLVDHLQPDDFFGVVTFGSQATMVVQPGKVGSNKDSIRNKIGDIYCNGSTNFSGGMLMAIDGVNKLDLGEQVVTRIIMLTDGAANVGVSRPDDIMKLAKGSRGRVSISAFGYGEDCSQEFLSTLAERSDGNYAFIGSPDDALSAFGKELGGLVSVHAQNIELSIAPTGDHEIVEVLSDVDVTEDGKGVKVTLADILAEEKRNIVIRMKLAAQKQAGPREVNVVEVKAAYSEVADGVATSKTDEVKAKAQFVKDGAQQKEADKMLDAIVGLAQIAKAQIEAEEKAKRGDYRGAAATFAAVGMAFDSRGLGDLNVLSSNLAGKYNSHHAYASSGSTRSATKGMVTRGLRTSTSNAADVALVTASLSAGGLTLSNASQGDTVASFTDAGTFADHTGTYAEPAGNDLSSVAGTIVNTDAITTSKSKSRSKRW